MTDVPAPSWINKRQPRDKWPAWLIGYSLSAPEANGSFMVRGKHGNLRVHPGLMVFEHEGHAYVCHPSEARERLAELAGAKAPPPPKDAPLGPGTSLQAEVADREDDTDDISARIRAQAGGWSGSLENAERYAKPVVSQRPAARVTQGPARNPVKTPVRSAPAKGSMPSIEWIQLDRLLVDDAYQRSVDTGPSRALIARIGREWDWRLCVPLMVSRREDGLYVIDGQHRLFGAQLRKDVPQLPCCISVYASPADEAAMFVAANRERRAMNRLDDFHAAQAGGDEESLAVAALIRGAGFTVARRTGAASWVAGEVAFTSAIARVRRKHGDPIPAQALKMMAEAFPDERLVAGSPIFTAVCSVLINPPSNFDPDLLFKALLTFDMRGWASFLAGAKGGDDRASRLRQMLLEAYDDAGKAVAA